MFSKHAWKLVVKRWTPIILIGLLVHHLVLRHDSTWDELREDLHDGFSLVIFMAFSVYIVTFYVPHGVSK